MGIGRVGTEQQPPMEAQGKFRGWLRSDHQRVNACRLVLDTVRLALVFPSILLLAVACTLGPGNVQTQHSTDLENRRIRRIAVMPPELLDGEAHPKLPSSMTADRPSEVLASNLYSVMAAMPNWQIISEAEVRDASRPWPAGNEVARLRQIGERVYADAVIVGRVRRYRERVGDEWGAKSPASVAFVLDLIDVRRGDVIWSARFDETQKSLSENLFAIGDVGQRGLRWLSASQLTRDGVKKTVAQLHALIARRPVS